MSDTIRAAYLAVRIAQEDLQRIGHPTSRSRYGDRYDEVHKKAVVALATANNRYNELTGRSK